MSYYYISHHGVKGQKWGVRRYQNYDGTYNAAGEKRYGIGDGKSYHKIKTSNKNLNQSKSQAKSSKQKLTGKQKARIALGIGATAAGVGLMAYGVHKSNQSSQARRDTVNAISKQTEALSAAKKTVKEVTKPLPAAAPNKIDVSKATVEKAVTKVATTPVKSIKNDSYDVDKLTKMIDGLNKDLLIKNEKELDDFFLK